AFYANCDAAAGIRSLCLWFAAGWRPLGRFVVPGCLCDHAGLPCLRPAGNYRCCGYPILDFGNMATARDVAISEPGAGDLFRSGVGRSFSLEVFLGTVVLCLSSRSPEHEV